MLTKYSYARDRSPYCKVEVERFVQFECLESSWPTSDRRLPSSAHGPAFAAAHHDEDAQEFEIHHLLWHCSSLTLVEELAAASLSGLMARWTPTSQRRLRLKMNASFRDA